MRFRTGFRIFVVGLGLAAAGAVLTRFVWDGFFWLAAAGIGLAIWFSRPSDWRKTWPGDSPITARLLGHHPVPDDRPRAPDFWETAPADKRLRQSMVGVLLGAGLIAWGA